MKQWCSSRDHFVNDPDANDEADNAGLIMTNFNLLDFLFNLNLA